MSASRRNSGSARVVLGFAVLVIAALVAGTTTVVLAHIRERRLVVRTRRELRHMAAAAFGSGRVGPNDPLPPRDPGTDANAALAKAGIRFYTGVDARGEWGCWGVALPGRVTLEGGAPLDPATIARDRDRIAAGEPPPPVLDPWGRSIRYRCPGHVHERGFDLYSVGPNGADGGGDDIVEGADIVVAADLAPVASGE